MSILYLVLPLALVIVLAAVLAFSWAARRGQFDDLETPALRAEFGLTGGGLGAGAIQQLPAYKRSDFHRPLAELNRQFPPPPRATVADFVNHIDYAVKLIGIDHVGISSDFDGGGGVEGWSDATETFNVTLELVRRGYTEAQIGKLWSGNLLRVLTDVQRVARELQQTSAVGATR